MQPKNEKIASQQLLAEMYSDEYFPRPQVDKVRDILLRLCAQIEAEKPATDEAFLALTHAATEEINALAEEFEENNSELETVARDCMAESFGFIAEAYGFAHVDVEELIAPRDW